MKVWIEKVLSGYAVFYVDLTHCLADEDTSSFFPCRTQQNRPLNSQNVADSLQKFNLKKAAVQKALDTLADNGRISSKEYGKQKIYLARQDQFDIPNSEELNRMKEENAQLQQQLEEYRKAISEHDGGVHLYSTC